MMARATLIGRTPSAFVALVLSGAVHLVGATAIQSPALYQCTPAAFQYQCTWVSPSPSRPPVPAASRPSPERA